MRQQLGFVDVGGLRVAYATVGSGPALVFPPPSFGHLQIEWEREEVRAFHEIFAARYTVVRYDRLGTGLSDRIRPPETLTVDAEVDVLEALCDQLGLGRVSLFGFSYGGVVAAAFAARRPERVARLLLYASYARGGGVVSRDVLESVVAVLRADWELGSRLVAEAFIPGADRDVACWFADLRRASTDGETAASLLELWHRGDVRDRLGAILAPTLVLHRRDDVVVPFGLGRELAALVPGARLEELEGRWHQPWMGDTGALIRHAAGFLRVPVADHASHGSDEPSPLTPRETEVLRLIAAGLGDAEIAERLVLSRHTVHRHVANIRNRLRQPSRAAAAAYAARLSLI